MTIKTTEMTGTVTGSIGQSYTLANSLIATVIVINKTITKKKLRISFIIGFNPLLIDNVISINLQIVSLVMATTNVMRIVDKNSCIDISLIQLSKSVFQCGHAHTNSSRNVQRSYVQYYPVRLFYLPMDYPILQIRQSDS